MANFIDSFTDSWISGDFKRWKIYNSPPGCSNTNSPIESFNIAVKRDYVKNRRYSARSFISVLKVC